MGLESVKHNMKVLIKYLTLSEGVVALVCVRVARMAQRVKSTSSLQT